MKSFYGHSGFTAAEHCVIARHVDTKKGEFMRNYENDRDAIETAHRMAGDEAYSDVIMLSRDSRGSIVQVFSGVRWFYEERLNVAHPGWRMHDDSPAPDTVSMSSQPPATILVPRWTKIIDENGEEDWVQELVAVEACGRSANDDHQKPYEAA